MVVGVRPEARLMPWAGQQYISIQRAALKSILDDNGAHHIQRGPSATPKQALPSARQAFEEGGLNWEVEKVPVAHLVLDDEGVGWQEIEGQVVLRRVTDSKPMLVVGTGYQPFQNRELAEFTDGLGVPVVAAGATDDGRRVFTVCKIPDDNLEPEFRDKLGGYVVTTNGHGGSSLACSAVIIEHACTNGLVGIVPDVGYQFRLRHTRNLKRTLAFQRNTMAKMTRYVEKTADLMAQLEDTPVNDYDVKTFLDELLPMHPKMTDRQRRAQLERRQGIHRQWRLSITMDEHTRRSAWGVIHAVSEWDQFGDGKKRRQRDDMTRLTNDSWSDLTNRARELILTR